MSTPDELQDKLWKALESDHTLMLGVPEAEYGHLRPMTALLDGRHSPLWFFARRPNALIDMADGDGRALMNLVEQIAAWRVERALNTDQLSQRLMKRACEVAVTGMHNLLFVGPPGAGKSLMAACMPGILPDLTPAEALEVSMIASVAGNLEGGRLILHPPGGMSQTCVPI